MTNAAPREATTSPSDQTTAPRLTRCRELSSLLVEGTDHSDSPAQMTCFFGPGRGVAIFSRFPRVRGEAPVDVTKEVVVVVLVVGGGN